MNFKAIIFDLDGTLLNTTKDIGLALSKALNHNFSDSQVMSFVGSGLKKAVIAASNFLGHPNANIDELTSNLIEHYRQVPVLYTRPYPGAVELLTLLQSRNIPFCVYSNKEQDLTQSIIDQLFPTFHFSLIVGMHGAYAPKPSSQAVMAFLSQVGVKNTDALYLGDTEVDYKTSQNSGTHCRILTNGMRSKEALLANGIPQSALVNSLYDIIDILN